MVGGVTSLNLVRDELFVTIEEAEHGLEMFIAERSNGSLLQQAVESLQQVRGTLNLIELAGAELMAQEVLNQATDIPVGAGEERDHQLSALSNALHVLRRYLEQVDAHRQEIPELLLPAINTLRQAGQQPALPESFFFSVRLDQARPAPSKHAPAPGPEREALLRRLRQMYQSGLIGVLREADAQPGLRLMLRAAERMDDVLASEPRGRLTWILAAALEAQLDGQLLVRASRKQLFARVDREFKILLASDSYEPPRALLKELLYLVTLADSHGERVSQLREVFGLTPLPFTDHLLADEYQRLAGPGKAVLRSLSTAINEELTSVKDILDLFERGTVQAEALINLHAVLGKLDKTLGMVGLSSAAQSVGSQLKVVESWSEQAPPQADQLQRLAEAVLYVESMVAGLERGDSSNNGQEVDEAATFASHQLLEARIVVLDEARAGLALAKRAITAFLDSDGDKMHLANVPLSLQAVRGGLWFLEQRRAAGLVGACAEYIKLRMIEAGQVPSQQMLETLADALSSLEYYLEAGSPTSEPANTGVLDLAEDSMRVLGMQVAA